MQPPTHVALPFGAALAVFISVAVALLAGTSSPVRASAFPPTPGPAGHVAQAVTYTVQQGDTLAGIAARFGTSLSALAEANGIADPDLIRVGMVLTVPGSSPDGGTKDSYVVEPGDTLAAIAARFGTSVSTLASLNGIADRGLIFVGQRIRLPGDGAGDDEPDGDSQTYRVEPGDTLAGIARRFGTSVSAIVITNDLADPGRIEVSELLELPNGGASEAIVAPDLTAIVNRGPGLAASYVPGDLLAVPDRLEAPGANERLREPAVDALARMIDAASAEGVTVRLVSGFRSYQRQAELHQYWVNQLGAERANAISARAGHSQHQLGTAVDVSSPAVEWELTRRFADTAAYRWLQAHAHDYGFALSYPLGEQDVTGFEFEPWHWRYIGVDLAQQWKTSGLALIEFLARR